MLMQQNTKSSTPSKQEQQQPKTKTKQKTARRNVTFIKASFKYKYTDGNNSLVNT